MVIGPGVRYRQPMTDKPQVIAIAHLHTGETLTKEIDGPPFPPFLDTNMFPEPRVTIFSKVFLRPGQDSASLEQHYDPDNGRTAFLENFAI